MPSRSVDALFAALISAFIAGCGTVPPLPERPSSWAWPPQSDSALVRVVTQSTPDPKLTGFRLMPLGFSSLDARVALARHATHALDVQYYLIEGDRTGRLLMRNLRDAALRGVHVRVLVDDLYTVNGDAMLRGLAAFPNVEVRLFNPFCCARQSVTTKFMASLMDFQRLNHRMHNKLFIADGVIAVMGGRNIADEYFTRSPTSNFVDMDVLVVGAVMERVRNIFDAYWNSRQAYPVATIVDTSQSDEALRAGFDRLVDEGEQMRSIPVPAEDMFGYRPLAVELASGRLPLVWGTAMAFADSPDKVLATTPEAARAMSVQMDIMDRVVVSKRSVMLSSPYFVPGEAGVKAFGGLAGRKVKVAILTNSLAANDVPLVHTGYARYRVELLRSGVELFELSPSRVSHSDEPFVPAKSLGRLHAKTAVIDESTVYIGSMNLDPRSESTNTEMGLLAESPELAAQVARVLQMAQRVSAYRVRFAPDGETLEWLSTGERGDVILLQEPEATFLMRLRSFIVGPFVPEQLL